MKTNAPIVGVSLLLALAGCGRDATTTLFKTPGVGLDPSTIGPEPELHNGLIEMDYLEFAGGGLPLGLIGLVSYTALDATGSSDPPYSIVTAQGFVSEAAQPRMDVLFGTVGIPHDAPGSCYTQYEPRAFLSSLVDVGDHIRFQGDGFGMNIGRRPVVYPQHNMEATRPYYSSFEPWRPQSVSHHTMEPGSSIEDARTEVLLESNWKHGAAVDISFPGGLPPREATFGSIPMPLGANGRSNTHTLPRALPDILMTWRGPSYGYDAESGDYVPVTSDGASLTSRCLQFGDMEDLPSELSDCANAEMMRVENEFGQELPVGQLYTGPWETPDGVQFSWNAAPEAKGLGTMVIGVRLLGPVDFDDKYKRVAQVKVPVTDHLQDRWDRLQSDGIIADGDDPPGDVVRENLACETEASGDLSWEIDPDLLDDNGDPVLGLQGEPSRVLAELICNVPDDGVFVITPEMMASAMAYGELHGAAGAIFYVARVTSSSLDTPDVRDRYGQRRPAEPVKVLTSTAKFGRFYWNR